MAASFYKGRGRTTAEQRRLPLRPRWQLENVTSQIDGPNSSFSGTPHLLVHTVSSVDIWELFVQSALLHGYLSISLYVLKQPIATVFNDIIPNDIIPMDTKHIPTVVNQVVPLSQESPGIQVNVLKVFLSIERQPLENPRG